ncbi:MAG: sulfate ABC transporter permease subunit CysT [Terrimicrobiaceae bacterium]|nr:sulfate ABC transporter permease subunit CysT [Terrimicrobiaceae bacterium]
MKRFTLPGFGLTLGYTLVYLTLIVLIPLSALFLKTESGGWGHFWQTITDPRVVASYRVSFGISLVAALINGLFGVLAAWVLVRYRFPGRRLLDALVDLPFALPTAVAGIALTTLYAPNEWIGRLFAFNEPLGAWFSPHTPFGAWLTTQAWAKSYLGPAGLRIAFTQLGVLIALTFIGLPFVVRTVQPVIQDLSLDVEEAAACLGATRLQTFTRVVLPGLLPAIFTGVTLAYGRAVGEYGSIVFISGNLPFKTEITPLLIISKLENYDYTGAAGLGFIMLLASFVILLISNGLQAWDNRRKGVA